MSCTNCKKSTVGVVKAVATGTANFVFKSAEIEAIAIPRLAKCKVCPHMKAVAQIGNDTVMRCTQCDCFCSLKARVPNEQCPLGLW